MAARVCAQPPEARTGAVNLGVVVELAVDLASARIAPQELRRRGRDVDAGDGDGVRLVGPASPP